jgi:hypothetical protein
LNDKRNCISKYTRIKKAVTKEFVHIRPWFNELIFHKILKYYLILE